MNKCNKCESIKELKYFPFRKDTGKYRNTCKQCETKRIIDLYNNDPKRKEYLSLWALKNKDHLDIYRKNRNVKNRQKINEYQRNINKNPEKKILKNERNKIYVALRHNIKCNSTIKLLDLNISDYKEYLECMFDENMTCNNYGTNWHIDHIIPISLFDLKNIDEQKMAFNFKNTRPLNAKENLSKGNRSISPLYDIIGIDLMVKNLTIKLKMR